MKRAPRGFKLNSPLSPHARLKPWKRAFLVLFNYIISHVITLLNQIVLKAPEEITDPLTIDNFSYSASKCRGVSYPMHKIMFTNLPKTASPCPSSKNGERNVDYTNHSINQKAHPLTNFYTSTNYFKNPSLLNSLKSKNPPPKQNPKSGKDFPNALS